MTLVNVINCILITLRLENHLEKYHLHTIYRLDCSVYIYDCIAEDLPRGRPPPELPPRSPTSTDSAPPLPPNQPDLLRQISAQGSPQSSSEGSISVMYSFLNKTFSKNINLMVAAKGYGLLAASVFSKSHLDECLVIVCSMGKMAVLKWPSREECKTRGGNRLPVVYGCIHM